MVEVISPNDVADEVNEKRDEWLDAGVKEVWIASLTTRTVQVYRADGGSPLFRARDTLSTALLPGFAAPVGDIFRRPDDPDPPPVQ